MRELGRESLSVAKVKFLLTCRFGQRLVAEAIIPPLFASAKLSNFIKSLVSLSSSGPMALIGPGSKSSRCLT